MSRIRTLPAVVLCAALAGCGGGPKYVKVSGVVKLDGAPYKNAVVSFQPQGTEANMNPGQGSSALTNEKGEFTLIATDGTAGAVPGKHRVQIQTKRDDPTAFVEGVGSDDNPDPTGKKMGKVDPIPLEWYGDKSTKTFDVPPGGTDQANFDITSVKGAKKK